MTEGEKKSESKILLILKYYWLQKRGGEKSVKSQSLYTRNCWLWYVQWMWLVTL